MVIVLPLKFVIEGTVCVAPFELNEIVYAGIKFQLAYRSRFDSNENCAPSLKLVPVPSLDVFQFENLYPEFVNDAHRFNSRVRAVVVFADCVHDVESPTNPFSWKITVWY